MTKIDQMYSSFLYQSLKFDAFSGNYKLELNNIWRVELFKACLLSFQFFDEIDLQMKPYFLEKKHTKIRLFKFHNKTAETRSSSLDVRNKYFH